MNIVDAVTCPDGHFARTSKQIIQQCNFSGLPCDVQPCVCKPCIQAFEDTFHFDKVNGTFVYHYHAHHVTVGQRTVQIRINGEVIPESPFRIIVTERNCERDVGDAQRKADDYRQCLCQRNTVEILDQCVSLAILIPCIAVLVMVLFLIPFYVFVRHKREQADNIWKIKPKELHFDIPPRILGCGSFGLVLKAEYRGATVAVKRVLPPQDRDLEGGRASMPSQIEFHLPKETVLPTTNHDDDHRLDGEKPVSKVPNSASGRKTNMSSL